MVFFDKTALNDPSMEFMSYDFIRERRLNKIIEKTKKAHELFHEKFIGDKSGNFSITSENVDKLRALGYIE